MTIDRASPPATAAQLIGQVLDGKYRLDSVIGRGGMGAVFRGHQLSMDRRIAVKIIHPELAADPSVSRRFAREARGTFKVDSDHAIKVIDFAASQTPAPGLLYMVMEFLDGRSVAKELDIDGALAPHRALHVARQVALALAASHRIGIIHRDIKPDNVMLIRNGDDPDFAKVLDFGLAKLIEDAPGDAGLSAAALTKHGVVFGTPDYMSPEQATGKKLDVRSDVYALGATLFEMLTARPPFLGASSMQVLVQHVKTPPPHLGDLVPTLAPHSELDRLIQHCLAKSPGSRPSTARDLVTAIDAVAAGLPSSEPRPSAAAGATLVLAAQPRTGGTHSVWLARLSETGDVASDDPPAPLIMPGAGWALTTTGAEHSAVSSIADRVEPETEPPPGLSRPVPIRRWPIAAVIAAAVGAGVILFALKQRGGTTSRAGEGTDDVLATAVGPIDAPPPVTPVPAVDAGGGASPDVATPPAHDATPPLDRDLQAERERKRREIALHLRAAEAGHAARNNLKQMTEAGEVLKLDRRHPRANFLFGDALVNSGDRANGCSYLKRGRGATAIARMVEAGCK